MPRRKRRTDPGRLNLAVAPETRVRIEDLQVRTRASTLAATIETALLVYQLLVLTREQGGKVLTYDAAGNREEWLIIY